MDVGCKQVETGAGGEGGQQQATGGAQGGDQTPKPDKWGNKLAERYVCFPSQQARCRLVRHWRGTGPPPPRVPPREIRPGPRTWASESTSAKSILCKECDGSAI